MASGDGALAGVVFATAVDLDFSAWAGRVEVDIFLSSICFVLGGLFGRWIRGDLQVWVGVKLLEC